MKKVLPLPLIVLLLFLAACGGSDLPEVGTPPSDGAPVDEPDENADEPGVSAAGNGNNIANYGMAAIEGEWIYYRGSDGGLYAVKTDGSGGKKLSGVEDAGQISVAGGRVYYLDGIEGGSIRSINVDGSGERQLSDDFAEGSVIVAGGYVYYTVYDDGTFLYRMRLDGSERARLLDDAVQGVFNISSDGYIYYAADGEDQGLYRTKIDGSEREKLGDGEFFDLNISDGYLYYVGSAAGEIWRMKTDGTDPEMICGDAFGRGLNVADGYVYFSDGDVFCRVKTDGSDREEIGDARRCYWFSVVDGRVFYMSDPSEDPATGFSVYSVYTMKTDGSEDQSVESFAGGAAGGVPGGSQMGGTETDLITWLEDHGYNIGWEAAENDPYGTKQKDIYAYMGSEPMEFRSFIYTPGSRTLSSYTTDGIGVTYLMMIRLGDDIPTEWDGMPYQNIPRKLQDVILEIALMFEDPLFSRAMLTDYMYQWEAWDLFFHFPPSDDFPEGESVHNSSDSW